MIRSTLRRTTRSGSARGAGDGFIHQRSTISAGLALGHADLVLKMAHRNDSTDTLIPMNDEVVS